MENVLERWTTFDMRHTPYIDINFFGSKIEQLNEKGEKVLWACEKKAYKNFKKLLKLLSVNDDSEIILFVITKLDNTFNDGIVIDYNHQPFTERMVIEGEYEKNGTKFIKGTISLDDLYYLMKRYFEDGLDYDLRLLFYFEESETYLQVIDELYGILVRGKNNPKNCSYVRNIFYKLQEIDSEIINIHWRKSMERCLGV